MHWLSATSLTLLSLKGALAFPRGLPSIPDRYEKFCKPISGDIILEQFQLYPENSDFSLTTCLLYFTSVWNATVVVYDPYAGKTVDIIEFPGYSHNPTYHTSGIQVDQRTNLLSISLNVFAPFANNGTDVSGTNQLVQYDTIKKEIVSYTNLTETTQGKFGGYQDVDNDPEGNVYMLGTYGANILRTSADCKTTEVFYLREPALTTIPGYGGCVSNGWDLIVNDVLQSKILKFDMRQEKGVPVEIPHTPNVTWGYSDAIILPPKYLNTVLLIAIDLEGIVVLRSKDASWDSAEYLGLIPNPISTAWTVAAVQVGQSVYLQPMEVGDINRPNPGPLNLTAFPLIDITEKLEALLGA
ncbi:hypothetical protein HYFRA_00003471 [Hymenoscyphus fraxineus]|uniref:Tri14-like protein n=1 Tax=Hymenoscyphus fraxineus TaxID=746836 RepID=A0A9N9KUE6_9HELO|nr:hypothetical protein HYFRA_00003471 [Hymenoscyphus fraxineus]